MSRINHYESETEVESLIPYLNNPRMHPPEQVDHIAASIKEFGFTNPIITDEEGGIIAGHGRLMAARKLGLDKVPTLRVTGLTEAQKRAYVVMDNQTALGSEWDMEKLQLELDHLAELDFDVDMLGVDLSLEKADGFLESHMSMRIDSPEYEPSDQQPKLDDCLQAQRCEELLQAINQEEDLPVEIRTFLVTAAMRHNVFNYEKIADYYAHAPANVQRLFEQSALVIVDYDSAVSNGFVRLNEKIKKRYQSEHQAEYEADSEDA